MQNISTSIYCRVPFDLADTAGIASVTLRMKYDDGFVAFLNGVEVADGNPPTNGLVWNAQAGADHTDSLALQFEDTDLTAQAGHLNVGNNVLAIHMLNRGPTSSDFLLLPRLEAEFVSNPGLGGPGYFQQPTPGTANGTDQGREIAPGPGSRHP